MATSFWPCKRCDLRKVNGPTPMSKARIVRGLPRKDAAKAAAQGASAECGSSSAKCLECVRCARQVGSGPGEAQMEPRCGGELVT